MVVFCEPCTTCVRPASSLLLFLCHSVDSGKHVEYDVQEIAVEMNREEETEEDWLKMDHPPEWLRRVEVEEYDDWLPPPVRPQPPPEVHRELL